MAGSKFGDQARLIYWRNQWMTGVYKKARENHIVPESSSEFCLAIEVGELFGEAMRTRLSRIPSDLFERGYSVKELQKFLQDLLEDKKKG